VEAIPPLEAWEACLLSSLEAPKERLVRLLQPRKYVLEDVGVDRLIFGKLRADLLEFGFLRVA
jgi:hypothetical protein